VSNGYRSRKGKSMTDYMDRLTDCPNCNKERWAGELHICKEPINIFELHEKFTKNLFPAYSSEDERFLALALCGEAGELANIIKKRWRDGVDLSEEACDEIADIRIYLELIAKCFNIEGAKLDERVKQKLLKVSEKHKARL
jgi:NTP pyrophosphatase (non-canonical NTP hydrolase)